MFCPLARYEGFGYVQPRITECPVNPHEVLTAMFMGEFRALEDHPSRNAYLGVEYTGWILERKDYAIVCDHGPGGLEVQVHLVEERGREWITHCWRTAIRIDEPGHEVDDKPGSFSQWEKIA